MDPHHFVTRRHVLATMTTAAVLPAGSFARPATISVIVNTNAGTGLDGIVRALQPSLAHALGSSIVVENQAGASGLIGLQMLARAPADGSTIGVASNNMVIFPSVLKSVPFDVTADFTPIAIFGEVPLVLVANPVKVPAVDAKEFAAFIRRNPDALNFASSGAGTVLHLASEMFLREVGVRIRHIPYKGATPMLIDVIGGQVDFATSALPSALPYIKSGALRAIGLFSPARASVAPQIPTFEEQGLHDLLAESWGAILGPRRLPPAMVKRYHEAVVTAMAEAPVRDAMAKQAMVIDIQTPEQTQATIRADFARYAKLVKQIGLQAQ